MPTVLTMLAITAFHTLTIVSARFHVPVEPLMAVWGAAGASRLRVLRGASALPSAGDDIERIRVKSRFGVVPRIKLQFLDRPNVHSSQQ